MSDAKPLRVAPPRRRLATTTTAQSKNNGLSGPIRCGRSLSLVHRLRATGQAPSLSAHHATGLNSACIAANVRREAVPGPRNAHQGIEPEARNPKLRIAKSWRGNHHRRNLLTRHYASWAGTSAHCHYAIIIAHLAGGTGYDPHNKRRLPKTAIFLALPVEVPLILRSTLLCRETSRPP